MLPFSHDRAVGAVWLLALAGDIAVFYGVVLAARRFEWFAAAILVAVVLGIAVLQAIALEYHLERGLGELIRLYERPEGWNGYPELGLLACIQIAILVGMFQAMPRPLERLMLVATMGVTILELALLYSRMAWATALAVVLIAPLAGRSTRLRWPWGVATAAMALGMAFLLAQTDMGLTLRARFTEPSTVTGRVDIWRRTAQMVGDDPLTGVGLGSFQMVYEPVYNPDLNPDERRGGHAHNLWLQVAAEQGLVTAAAYSALWVAVLVLAWRQRLGSWLQRAALLVVIAVTVRSLGDYMFFSTGGAPARLHTLMWITWGIVCAEPASAGKAR